MIFENGIQRRMNYSGISCHELCIWRRTELQGSESVIPGCMKIFINFRSPVHGHMADFHGEDK